MNILSRRSKEPTVDFAKRIAATQDVAPHQMTAAQHAIKRDAEAQAKRAAIRHGARHG